MEILFVVNSCRIFQIDKGGALRNNLFLKALSELGHVDIISFSEDNIVSNIDNSDVMYSKSLGMEVHRIDHLRSLIKLLICPNSPYSFYEKDKQKEAIVDSFVKKKKYDIIACRYFDAAVICGLLKYKSKLVIDVDDNPSNVFKIESAQALSNRYRYELLYRSKKVVDVARRVLDGVFCSFCSNPNEIPSSRTIYLPNTSSLKCSESDILPSTSPRILFVGGCYYFPCKHGASHFADVVFPLIKQSIPSAELRVVGDGSDDFLSYLNAKDGVEAVGRVDDLEKEYREAAVVVIPIYHGTGTCVKFIEALLMNRPVVSSVVGARGFDGLFQDGVHYMLAKTDEEFAEKTISLLSSVSKAKEMAQKGFELANKHFSKERFSEIVKEAILNSLQQ